MLALGISTQRTWIDHPSYNRGTYNDPYRRATQYVSSSGWSSQIASGLPASHFGGTNPPLLPEHKRHKPGKTGRRIKETERERKRRERLQRRAITRGDLPGQDRVFHGHDPDFDRRVERHEAERHNIMQERRGLTHRHPEPWNQGVQIKRERIEQAEPGYFKRRKVSPSPAELGSVQMEEEKTVPTKANDLRVHNQIQELIPFSEAPPLQASKESLQNLEQGRIKEKERQDLQKRLFREQQQRRPVAAAPVSKIQKALDKIKEQTGPKPQPLLEKGVPKERAGLPPRYCLEAKICAAEA